MQFLPVIFMAIGAAASVYSMKQQMDAADDAKEIAQSNADAASAEGNRQAAILMADQETNAARMRASAAASGAGGSSMEDFMTAQDETRQENLDWTKTKTASNVSSELAGGKMASSTAQAGAAGSLGNAASFGGKVLAAWPT